ncbi:MAG: hypothetical protein SH807_02020 [Blastochloris sp.]|jgi:hypothetical protein|nr:hypothetical protein [Blastochloris sp.]
MKKSEIRRPVVEKEKRKLLKVMILLAKVYKKGAKSKEERVAYDELMDELKSSRKKL